MAARGSRYGRRLLSSFLTVTLQTETGGANSRTAQGQAQGVLRSVHGWQEGIRDMVSRPTTWLQQRNTHRLAVPHRRTYPGAVVPTARPYPGLVLPTARCHTVTSHTFSTKFSPPQGGAACVHCCTVHSSANIAQRSEEKQQAVQEDQKEEEEEEDLDEKYRNLTLFQRFKYMVKDYGHVLIPVHVATSLVWFGSFYYMAICGIDPVPLLEQIGLPHSWVETMKKSGASDVMVAYAFYKVRHNQLRFLQDRDPCPVHGDVGRHDFHDTLPAQEGRHAETSALQTHGEDEGLHTGEERPDEKIST
ncbi:protein FAM210A-like isoform X2 [Branchiostoma lanceolatum]|uniref:protein FAM210A-like isoform X2 n=1 Tax=Branchiostoma lanceolatum TaxID=7740 RepID=UPI00345175CB